MPDNLLPYPLSPSQVRSYIQFDGSNDDQEGDSSQAILQSQGVAALWQLLQSKGFAYLGDEVGMGKTRQAMGVIATHFLSDPNSHVVIVCPGVTLQEQWVREWDAFIRGCYRAKDNRLTSEWDGGVLQRLAFHDRLRDFAKSLLLNENRIHLLRYSSFRRPIWFGEADIEKQAIDPVQDIIETYKRCLREIGISKPSPDEEKIFKRFQGSHEESWRLEMTTLLNKAYSKWVGKLLKARDIDLVIFDEAQYLRNIDNYQNSNIRHVFRSHAKKWLFMSATPIHTGSQDIASLDHYLCIHESGHESTKKCPDCGRLRCPQAGYRLKRKVDVVDILKEFLVRRNRSYQDADLNMYGKVEYRKYDRNKIVASGDPFTALTMALVQKRLVGALTGKNNRFRQGECSSFESLSSSLKKHCLDRDGVSAEDKEFEQKGDAKEKQEETPDRSFIDALNKSFRRAMLAGEDAETASIYNMPHAKLNETAARIFELDLRNGSNRKSLVFVRRLDTVDELLTLLLAHSQSEVDRRLELWRSFLAEGQAGLSLREDVWGKNEGSFWTWRRDAEDDLEGDEDVRAEMGTIEVQGENEINLGRAGELPYFESLKRYKNKNRENGMLSSFQSRLLVTGKISSNPLRGFLLVQPDSDHLGKGSKDVSSTDDVWIIADKCWELFIEEVMGKKRPELIAEGSTYGWLFIETPGRSDEFWRLATLKRCIFQSFRQSDFLVDLYVMNRFIKQVATGKNDATLQEKLLWVLGAGSRVKLPDDLETYVTNWKEKIRSWVEYFDLIVDKCLRSDDANDWQSIYSRVDGAFARMVPAFGRSGRLQDKNAATQFKFPTHPNVLVCTDVLKEGVDLHLFCDEVIHYGVAWTSGDLEQRIGRVDRFGSMISRTIGMHRNSANPPTILPKLHVEFPFLDGTLDKHQVERVITAKLESDLRMDLGKRTDELGVISVENLELNKVAFERGKTRRIPHDLIFFPDSVPKDVDDAPSVNLAPNIKLTTECFAGQAHLKQGGASRGNCNYVYHIAAIGAVVCRCPTEKQPGNPSLLRSYLGISGRKRKICLEEEVLIPANDGGISDFTENSSGNSLIESLSVSGTHAVSNLLGTREFCFSKEWNTLVYNVKIDSPFEDEYQRNQVVLLEYVKGFWLLRTPIMVKSEGGSDKDLIGSPLWLAEKNTDRKWGYLVEDRGIIWFMAFVLKRMCVSDVSYLSVIAERAGKIGDRMQHLYVAADDPEEWGYRAISAFPEMPYMNNSMRVALEKGEFFIMNMEKADLGTCGKFLCNLQGWYTETFHDVLAVLYGDDIPESGWSLKTSTLAILPGGVLHLITTGAERFRLQAFLQLYGSPDAFPTPRIIWELAVSPNLIGTKPSLKLSLWENLPHVNPEGWQGEGNEHCGVYVSTVGDYRFLTIYHDPTVWNSSAKKILMAWGNILTIMQGSRFMRDKCKKTFVDAIQ